MEAFEMYLAYAVIIAPFYYVFGVYCSKGLGYLKYGEVGTYKQLRATEVPIWTAPILLPIASLVYILKCIWRLV